MATASNGVYATCDVTAEPKKIEVTSISFKKSNIEVTTNVPTLLEVVINPNDATDKSVTYSISNGSYGSVSDGGVLTATKAGSFTVTATSSNGLTAVCNVTASDPEPEYIEVTNIYFKELTKRVIINSPTTLEVVVEPSNATEKELEFTISDSSCGSITNKGVLTATKKADFTVTAKTKNGLTANCSISSGAGAVTSISINKIELTMNEDPVKDVSYTVSPKDAFQNIRYYIPSSPYVAYTDKGQVKAYQAGQTKLTLWDDVNDNKALDSGEYSTSTEVYVHDYSEVSSTVEASCTSDGKNIRTCKCGCGNQRTETIPAKNHEIVETITKAPTCTNTGSKKLTCKHCSYSQTQSISAYGGGHNASVQDTSLKFLAERGNFTTNSKYYYKCSKCGEKTSSTYTYGNFADFTNLDRLEAFFSTNKLATRYKALVNIFLNKFNEYKSKSFSNFFRVSFDEDYNVTPDEIAELRKACAAYADGFPFVHSNTSSYTKYRSNGKITGYTQVSYDGYESLDKRNQDFPTYFNAVNSAVDPLIRDEATDAEKALILSLYTANYFTYDKGGDFFFTSLKNKKGNCFPYSYLLSYLCYRYNLPCMRTAERDSAISGNVSHGWNCVSIDGTWYTFDVTNSDCNMNYLFLGKNPESFLTANASPTNLVKDGTESIKNKLIQVYKNDVFSGIYYNLDTALKQVNDKNADYKIVLGIGYDGVQNLAFSSKKSYFLSSYETSVKSVSCKSLKFVRCSTTYYAKPTVTIPAALSTVASIGTSNVLINTK